MKPGVLTAHALKPGVVKLGAWRRSVKLELNGITKRYGSLVANDHIDLTVEPGQIHALLGENGAGKTTLMNVLYGLLQPDEGQILVDDQPQKFGSPADAIKAGIGMVHQHFMLVPVFTVAENVTLGMERTRALGLLDRRRTRRDVRELSERYGLQVDPDALVEDLPVGVQQRVEIVKALMREANVLILDEPTSVLTPGETEELFRIMRELRAGGRSIVFISHKLKEVQAIADTITVIRRGRVVGERPPTASDAELASLMVGRSVQLRVSKPPANPGDVLLDVQDLTVAGEHGQAAVDGVSFQVRAGEILGVAGVQGNGQTELCEALLGVLPTAGGSVHVEGRDLTRATPRQRLRAGLGYIPEDRQEDGLVASFSVADNLILDVYNQPPYASGIALDLGTINATAAGRVAQFDIRTTSTATPAGTLSGGNQQKVILAREIGRDVRVLVASQPTRGLDVGSIEFVHRRIVEERDQGVAVLIVSSELDEIYALSDRIAVMYEGRITGFRPPTVPAEELGLLMAGASDAQAAGSSAVGGQGPAAEAGGAVETGLMETGLLGIGIPEATPADGSAAGDATPDATSADDSGAEQP
jgi:simple sugar transport system ATP-binding protein